MKMSFEVHCDSLVVPEGQRASYESICRRAKFYSEGVLVLTIEVKPKPHTHKERNYFHALCGQLSGMSGMKKEELKNLAKDLAMREFGYPYTKDAMNVPVFENNNLVPKSTSLATEEEYRLLIEAVFMIAGEYGYTLEK